ncbi:hypothetical protein [Micromonospora sp. KC606]|uniref:hypothetical protein n=1 Tax=Micromonospora sp. KC606 TaxID=2530379 RepID=UPI001404562F|nr:hypothetical protein [Micromonospora sp. KC606]
MQVEERRIQLVDKPVGDVEEAGATSPGVPAQYTAAYADYRAALDRAGMSEHTRRAYASRVAGYLRWLADADLADGQAVGDPTGADPLANAWARDFAVRDYRVWLLTVAKKAPNTVNAHLTAGLPPIHTASGGDQTG